MRAKDNAYCGYNVGEAEQYGLIKAIILNQIRWYLRTLGKQFDGKKCWRSIKDLADDTGIPYETVKKYLPTEEMGIKHYAGYKPGTMTRTTWWEECDINNVETLSERVSYTLSDGVSYTQSYNKEENKEEKGHRNGLATISKASPLSVSVHKSEAEGEDVVDLKAVKKAAQPAVDGKTVFALLNASGKKGAVTASLVRLVRVQAKKYGLETLFEVAKKSRFDEFYSEMGLQTLLAEKNIENILNKGNSTSPKSKENKEEIIKAVYRGEKVEVPYKDGAPLYCGVQVELLPVQPNHFAPIELVTKARFPFFEFNKDTMLLEPIKVETEDGYTKWYTRKYRIDPATGEHIWEKIVEEDEGTIL